MEQANEAINQPEWAKAELRALIDEMNYASRNANLVAEKLNVAEERVKRLVDELEFMRNWLFEKTTHAKDGEVTFSLVDARQALGCIASALRGAKSCQS